MIVIADSSPLIVLAKISLLEILPKLFGQVTIPPQVAAELSRPNRPQIVQALIANRPAWLAVQSPLQNPPIATLQEGEIAAINLARELHSDLLLIDEIQGRKAAVKLNIAITGTIGVIELAAKAGLVDLNEAFSRMKQTDFWVSPKLLDERLKRFKK